MNFKRELAKLKVKDILKVKENLVNIFDILDKYTFKDFRKIRNVLADIERDLKCSIWKKS